MKGISSAIRTCVIGLSASLAWPASAQPASKFQGDKDLLNGDHLVLRTNAHGFKDQPASTCAPQGSELRVVQESDGIVTVQFKDIPSKPRGILGTPEVTQEALDACPQAARVNTHTSYQISRVALEGFGFRRSGVTFGGLVVPFKYRLGGDKGIISSSTVAPYVGFRTSYLQGYGVSFTPIASAGLGLVPVTNATAGTTDTKTAFSLALGIVMTSSKNDQFNAGLIVGKDLLSKSDRALDPNVDKAWLSFYLGVAMQ